MNFTE